MFLLFRNSLQNLPNIFFFCQTSAIFIYPSMPSGTCVFFGQSRCLNSVLISLLSDDFFPPKKVYS